MIRRSRRIKRFVPRLEALEHRHLLAAVPLPQAAALAALPIDRPGTIIPEEAVGSENGKLEVLAVMTEKITIHHEGLYELNIYNYNAPTAGAAVGTFTQTQTLDIDNIPATLDLKKIPADFGVTLAFGNLQNGLPDLVVAGSDGSGAVAVDVFSGFQTVLGSPSGGTASAAASTGAGQWQFTPDAASGKVIGMTSGGGNKGSGVALADLNGDGIPDVILTTSSQVGVLLGGAATSTGAAGGYTFTPLPVVSDPFASVIDSKNISDGAAKSQAVDTIIQNDGGGYDLVTEADNQFLFTPIVIASPTPAGTSGTSTAAVASTPASTSTVTFPGTIQSVAIQSSGTDNVTTVTSPLQGGAPPASEVLTTGIICIVSPCPGDGTQASLMAVIGRKVYVGTETMTASGGLGFTWTSDVLDHATGRRSHDPLFLADVNNSGQMDLFWVVEVRVQRIDPTIVVAAPNVLPDGTYSVNLSYK